MTYQHSKDDTLGNRAISGAKWLGILKVLRRIISFAKYIIIARFLVPEDFGLMGIALVCVYAFSTFSQTGFRDALIQKKEEIESYMDCAWSLQFARGVLNVLLIYCTAPLFALFFKEPRAIEIIRVFALVEIFRGLTSIRVVFFQKYLEFNKQFKYEITGVLVDVFISVPLAIYLRNVWALVLGILANEIALFVMSYVLYPHLPKFDFSKSKLLELFYFGKWMTLQYIVNFLQKTLNSFFIGRMLGPAALGLYNLAATIASVTSKELGESISQVVFPAYSVMQDDISRLQEAFIKVQKILVFIVSLITIGIIIVGDSFVAVFLGNQWIELITPMKILALSSGLLTLSITVSSLFMGIGKPRISSLMNGLFVVVLLLTVYPLTKAYGLNGAAIAYLISSASSTFPLLMAATRVITLSLADYLKIYVYPLFISSCLLVIAPTIANLIPKDNQLIMFITMSITVLTCFFAMAAIMDHFFSYGLLPVLKEIFLHKRKNVTK